jgi:Uncharacterized conserved protein
MRTDFLNIYEQFKSCHIEDAVDFDRFNEILISHHSTAIEGSSLTESESRVLLADGITAKGKSLEDHNMVADHHAALKKTIELAKAKKKPSPELIQELSALVLRNSGGEINAMGGTYNSANGDFRKSMVHVGARYFPDFRKVPQKVSDLCELINSRIDTLKSIEDVYGLAFDAHFILVSIHPFADGNGRVSRLLMNFVLSYHNIPLALIFAEDKAAYYDALELSREQETTKPFHDFMYAQQAKHFAEEIRKSGEDCFTGL